MRPILMAAGLVLVLLFLSSAAAQGTCLECRRMALDELTRCQAVAVQPAERAACDRGFAASNRECATGICTQQVEAYTSGRCADCRGMAGAESERCRSLPAASEAQIACAHRAGDMLAACETRICRLP
jgi:hypothetical protein